jgi:hypothetical protein
MGSNEIFLKPKCELLNDQNMIPRYALKGELDPIALDENT